MILIADARTEGCGISYFDNIRTSDNNDPEGDRAISISNMPMSFAVDHIQEAASYGAYFLEQTASYCADLNGGSAPWATLATEYGTLSADAKNYFVAVSTTEPNIEAARERYEFMYTKYVAFQSNNFIVDSNNNPYYPVNVNIISETHTNSANSLYMIMLVGISGFSFLAYMVIRKKKVIQ